jgi:hypothetical protein
MGRSLFPGTRAPSAPGLLQCWGFTITLSHTTLGRTPLDDWSARRRVFYLTTHNTRKRQDEHAIPGNERLHTHILTRPPGTATGCIHVYNDLLFSISLVFRYKWSAGDTDGLEHSGTRVDRNWNYDHPIMENVTVCPLHSHTHMDCPFYRVSEHGSFVP